MTFLSLFSGVGGLDLGLERAGMKCIAQVEWNPFRRAVLAKHWPDVPKFPNVMKFCRRAADCEPEDEDGERMCPRCGVYFSDCDCVGTDQFTEECGWPDLVCGGFPCQPVSVNGRRKGQGDARWLWPEFQRILSQLRPRWALLENVPGLLAPCKGRPAPMGAVLGDLAAIGYDAEWDCLPAGAFGAWHLRDRIFIVAYPQSTRSGGLPVRSGPQGQPPPQPDREAARVDADAAAPRPQGQVAAGHIWGRGLFAQRPRWGPEPAARVVHGVPNGMDRISALGDAVVPAVAEYVGRLILEAARR